MNSMMIVSDAFNTEFVTIHVDGTITSASVAAATAAATESFPPSTFVSLNNITCKGH